MKAILILEMPSKCIDCPLHFFDEPEYWCGATMKYLLTDDIETYKPDWCPLKPMPQRANNLDLCDAGRYDKGYNACIDEILGEGK